MKNLSGITTRYLGRPYSEYGCVEFVYYFLRDLGTPLPGAVDGWTVENYTALVDADIKAAQQTMLKAFQKIGRPGSRQYPSLGDLLVVRQDPDIFFPAVYVGNGQGMASFIKKGVAVFRLDELNMIFMTRKVS